MNFLIIFLLMIFWGFCSFINVIITLFIFWFREDVPGSWGADSCNDYYSRKEWFNESLINSIIFGPIKCFINTIIGTSYLCSLISNNIYSLLEKIEEKYK